MSDVNIKIVDVIEDTDCVAADDGQRLYRCVADSFDRGDVVHLSFNGVLRITTAFLNAAIGQLYGEFSEDQVRDQLKVIDTENWHLKALKKVVDGAKEYFKNVAAFDAATKEIIGEDDAK